jgi:hypothetical protein
MIQSNQTLTQKSLVIGGNAARYEDTQTFVQDAGVTTDIVYGTIVGKDPATAKWSAWEKTLATGALINVGIYSGEPIPFAELNAGDVVVEDVMVGGDVVLDEDLLIINNDTDAIDDAFGTGIASSTARFLLYRSGMFARKSENNNVA